MCPCMFLPAGASLGAFGVAILVHAVANSIWSRPIWGVDMGVVLANAVHGNFTPAMVLALGAVLFGICLTVAGLRAALTHDDPISWLGLLLAGALLWWMGWGADQLIADRRFFPADQYFGMRAFMIAVEAFCAAYIVMQLRGLVIVPARVVFRFLSRPRPATPAYLPVPVFNTVDQIEFVARLAGERDQAIAERDQIARAFARQTVPPALPVERDAGRVLQLPGVGRAVLAALHPDRVKTKAEKRVATERFQTASNVLDKLGARQ